MCAPKRPEELTFAQLKAKLDGQYGTKKLVLAERYRFYSYKQLEGQSLVNYIAELRRLAATCEWTQAQLDDNIHDKFVMGLRNERLLQQLLSQDHTKPLAELLDLAHTFEAAERESLQRADKNEVDTGTVAETKQPKQHVTAVTTNTTCTLQEIITMNEALFKPQLGCCTTFKATLTLCDDRGRVG